MWFSWWGIMIPAQKLFSKSAQKRVGLEANFEMKKAANVFENFLFFWQVSYFKSAYKESSSARFNPAGSRGGDSRSWCYKRRTLRERKYRLIVIARSIQISCSRKTLFKLTLNHGKSAPVARPRLLGERRRKMLQNCRKWNRGKVRDMQKMCNFSSSKICSKFLDI